MLLILLQLALVLAVNGKSVPSNTDNWAYIGCYADDRPRDLTSIHKDTSRFTGMDLLRCYKFCLGFKTMYMALQSGNQCRCDNSYGRYGKISEKQCDEPCTRTSSQICGGSWANSVYKIRNQPATTVTASMMSLQTSDSKLTFTALGDWGKEGSSQRQVARELGIWSEKHKAAFTTAIGDNFYEFGVGSVKDSKFETTWKKVYTHKSLQNPWLVVEGNHDYLLGNAPYQVMYGDIDKRWVMPSLYYSMHYAVGDQDVHFIFLDTDPIRRDYEYHQYNWLKDQLENSNADWFIVVGHHPVASSGSHGKESSTATMYDNIRPLLVRHKVALYICGHDHFLEHLVDSSGVVDYVISGSGAKTSSSGRYSKAVDNLKKKNIVSKYLKNVNGFAGITVQGNRVTVSYIDKDGDEIYRFSKINPKSSSSGSDVIG